MKELRLFGIPRLIVDDQIIELSRRKSFGILVWLAIRETPVIRDSLLSLFWPASDPEKARASLRTALSSINTESGTRIVDADGERISLDAELVTDLSEFRRGLAELPVEETIEEAAGHGFDRLLELAARPLLETFNPGTVAPEFDDAVLQTSEETNRVLEGLLEKSIRAATLAGNWDQGIDRGRRWLRLSPLNESAHRRMMELYAWSGRKDAALEQFSVCRELMNGELGMEPDEETLGLRDAISGNRLPVPPVTGKQDPRPWSVQGITAGSAFVLSASLGRAGNTVQSRNPWDAASVVNLYILDAFSEVLDSHGAAGITSLGDRFVALFGFPEPGQDDAYHASLAALALNSAAMDWGFQLAIGIARGLVYRRSGTNNCDDGLQELRYLAGPGVNAASELRFACEPGELHMDGETAKATSGYLPSVRIRLPGAGPSRDAWKLKH